MAFMDHYQRVGWNQFTGKAHYLTFEEQVCGVCHGKDSSYEDDYGSLVFCKNCGGRGKVSVPVHTPLPEFDAPAVPPDWKPNDV